MPSSILFKGDGDRSRHESIVRFGKRKIGSQQMFVHENVWLENEGGSTDYFIIVCMRFSLGQDKLTTIFADNNPRCPKGSDFNQNERIFGYFDDLRPIGFFRFKLEIKGE